MQPYNSHALVADRTAQMRQEARATRFASVARRARRAGRSPVPVRSLRTAVLSRRPQRAGLPAA